MSTLNIPSVSDQVKTNSGGETPSVAKPPQMTTSKQDISESTARVAADLSEQKSHSAQSIERLRERLERTIESLNVDLELSETNLNF